MRSRNGGRPTNWKGAESTYDKRFLCSFLYWKKVAKSGKKWQKVAKSSKKWQKVECHQFQNSFYKLFNVFSGISEPPEEPRHLKVLEATSSTARLSWERPKGLQTNNEDDQLPIKSFTIEWTPIQGKPMSTFICS